MVAVILGCSPEVGGKYCPDANAAVPGHGSHTWLLALGRVWQEDHVLEVNLSYTWNSRPAWATRPCLKENKQTCLVSSHQYGPMGNKSKINKIYEKLYVQELMI